jgi:hypothetical protein
MGMAGVCGVEGSGDVKVLVMMDEGKVTDWTGER